MSEGVREGGRRENHTRAGATQTHLKTEKKQGKMRAGAVIARLLGKSGSKRGREDRERKKEGG